MAHDVNGMLMDGDAVWVSAGPSVVKFLRGKEVSAAHRMAMLAVESDFIRPTG